MSDQLLKIILCTALNGTDWEIPSRGLEPDLTDDTGFLEALGGVYESQ